MNPPTEPYIAQSTIDAAVYLIRFAPTRLGAWLDRHWPDGELIDDKARAQIGAWEHRRRGSTA